MPYEASHSCSGRCRPGRSVQRAFGALGPAELRRLAGARAAARAAAWEAGAGPDGDEAIIDLDATIVRTKADKEDAAPTHKRTYGHHPLLAMVAETGEVLAGMFRPGNAGANNAADHVVVLAAADRPAPRRVAGRPPARRRPAARPPTSCWSAPTRPGRRTGSPRNAGTATCGFSLGYWIDDRVRDALLLVQEEDWEPAREADGRGP